MDKVAITIGKFDGFHKGHMLLIDRLKEIKEEGYQTKICMIDAGKPRILSLDQQKEVVKHAGIDELILFPFTKEFSALSPEAFVKKYIVEQLRSSYIIIGNDFCFGHDRLGNVDFLKELGKKYGFIVESFDKLKIDNNIVSSSLIRRFLEDGNITDVKRYLGRDIKYTGEVLHGRHLGTGIGFPTVNLYPEERHLLPKYGVYKSIVEVDGVLYTGLTNIGVKPTVEGKNDPGIETFILDFNKDIYGSMISVSIDSFIRPEMRFSSLDELKKQISSDLKKVRQ